MNSIKSNDLKNIVIEVAVGLFLLIVGYLVISLSKIVSILLFLLVFVLAWLLYATKKS